MGKPFFKATALRILGPDLEEHGFMSVPESPSSSLEFRRRLRDYDNRIELWRHESWGKAGLNAVRLKLYAPNFPSMGMSSSQLPGGRDWWVYSTQEEWESCLQHMRELLLSVGLSWFDTNTPGNLPGWRDALDHVIVPLMNEHGFEPFQRPKGTLLDFPAFRHVQQGDRMIGVDFRAPGEVRVWLGRGVRATQSPVFSYGGEKDLLAAVECAKQYIIRELPDWMKS